MFPWRAAAQYTLFSLICDMCNLKNDSSQLTLEIAHVGMEYLQKSTGRHLKVRSALRDVFPIRPLRNFK